MIRTRKVTFLESRASLPLTIMAIIVVVVGMVIPFTNFGTYIGLVLLPSSYFLWFTGIIIAYSALIQIAKNVYIKKFDS